MITGLHHTAISVGDMDRSLVFYRDLLGFKVLRQVEAPGDERLDRIVGLKGSRMKIAMLQVGDSAEIIELIQYISPRGKPLPEDTRQCDLGVSHVCFKVSGIDSLYSKLVSQGVKFNCPVQTMNPTEAGVARVTYFHDPDGITLELLEMTPLSP